MADALQRYIEDFGLLHQHGSQGRQRIEREFNLAHMVQRYRELITASDITELPHIGHYPQVEAPASVLAAYLEFRQKLLR